MTESIIATRDGKVGTVDGTSGNFAQIATSNLDFSDIALSNSGELFGITFGNLYKIDRNLGSASLVGNFGLGSSVQLNALEFANNILYASDLSKLYTIDTSNGAATLAANLGSEFDSSGDLVFDVTNNRFLATSIGTTSDSLFSISLTGQATKIGNIGFTNVFGLSFENGNLIGFTEDRKRITINSTTGTGTFDRNLTGISGDIGGASSILSVIPTPPTPTPPTSLEIGAIKNRTSLDLTFRPTISIRLFQDTNTDGNPDPNPTIPLRNIETYVVIHGNIDSVNEGKMASLAKTISEQNKQVIVLDWSVAANNELPNISAGYIHDVAKFAVDIIKNKWKIDSKNLNLIGHSLGSYVASEIGFLFSNKEPDKALDPQYRQNPNIDQENRVNSLTALDPAALLGGNLPSSGLYDLDASINFSDVAAGAQNPIKFSSVAKFSRAFWGDIASGDGLGSSDYATSANESIYVDVKKPDTAFKDSTSPNASHGDIVYLFSNLLKESGEIAKLFKLGEGKHREWRENTFGGNEAILVANRSNNEGNDPNISPSLLFLKDQNTQNDDIAYGSTMPDKLDGGIFDRNSLFGLADDDATFNGFGNDKLYADSGNDEIFSGSGNDTLYGDRGNDTINGEQDNDLIFGDDNDDRIWGGKGDDIIVAGGGNDNIQGDNNKDFLTGGVGSDILNGGPDDDILYGGTDKEQDTLIGGLGNTNFLLGLGNGLPVTQDKRNRDKVDIIEDFRAGILLGFGRGGDPRGISAIGLANGLKPNQIEVERFGGLLNPKTAIIANGQYLAVINGEWLNKADLRLNEIPDLVS
jgi:Ca2+-binding RTX toxin-like protein